MMNDKGKEMSAKGMAKKKEKKPMGYNKGGIIKANCGASVPASYKKGKK